MGTPLSSFLGRRTLLPPLETTVLTGIAFSVIVWEVLIALPWFVWEGVFAL